MTRPRAVFLTVIFSALVTVPAAAQEPTVTISIEPAETSLILGETTILSITIHNPSNEATGALAIHIDVTDPTSRGSVDPEDWSSTLTRRIGSLDGGASQTLEWELQPISGGSFAAYAVALPEQPGADIWVSNSVRINVEERRSLNPNGVLPVALASPAIVGVLLLTRLRRRT